MSDGADILWLQDPEQNIRMQAPVQLPPSFVGYRCITNYRSPTSIARFIRRNLEVDFECGNDLPGLGVGLWQYDEPEEQDAIVGDLVRNLLRRGFTYRDIVVISLRGIGNSRFGAIDTVGDVRLRRFTGAYDDLGNQIMSDGELTFESIHRFKGQQSPAVILVDVDPDPSDAERARRLLNTAMTRASVRLDIVSRRGNEIADRFKE